MNTTKYTGIEIEGVLFDGTFESTIEIANFLRENAQHRVSKFEIVHHNTDSRLGQTKLTFNVEPMKNAPNTVEQGNPQTYTLRVGDFFRIQANWFEVIDKKTLNKFFKGSIAEID